MLIVDDIQFKGEKIIFLDIDGVLIPEGQYLRRDKWGSIFNSKCVMNLFDLVENSGAWIVLNSDWSKNGVKSVTDMWYSRHMPPMIKVLTRGKWSTYSNGIHKEGECSKESAVGDFLHDKLSLSGYVILDDLDIYPRYKDHFVKVDPKTGLTKDNISEALNILG